MNQLDRNRMRKLQDQVVDRLESSGYSDDMKVEGMYDNNLKPITLKSLKTMLYPMFEYDFKAFLD